MRLIAPRSGPGIYFDFAEFLQARLRPKHPVLEMPDR